MKNKVKEFFTGNELKLLTELCKDSSQSNGRLAEKVGIHSTTVRRLKKTLEERIGLRYAAAFNPTKMPSFSLYHVLLKLSPEAKICKESGKTDAFFKSRPYILGYGECTHEKWDAAVLFYCDEDLFDECFREFKSMVDPIIEDMDIIKVSNLSGFSKLSVSAVIKQCK
jgi:DNA-binding Lrp family transcriptional regulator